MGDDATGRRCGSSREASAPTRSDRVAFASDPHAVDRVVDPRRRGDPVAEQRWDEHEHCDADRGTFSQLLPPAEHECDRKRPHRYDEGLVAQVVHEEQEHDSDCRHQRDTRGRSVELAHDETQPGEHAPDEGVLQRQRRPEHHRRKQRHDRARGDCPGRPQDAQPDRGRERGSTGAGDRDHQLAGEHGRAEPCEGRQREEERRRLPEDRVVVVGIGRSRRSPSRARVAGSTRHRGTARRRGRRRRRARARTVRRGRPRRRRTRDARRPRPTRGPG